MGERDFLASLNGIKYSEDELDGFVGGSKDLGEDEVYMSKHFIVKAVSEKETYDYISGKLRSTEEVLHIMGTENMHARGAQSGMAIGSGIGALPFLQMQINAVVIVTNERLFVAMLDGDFQTADLREYALEEVDYMNTVMDGVAEYFNIKLKNKKHADFILFSPGYNYEIMRQKLEGPLSKKGVRISLKDEKMAKKFKKDWILVWGFVVLMMVWIVVRNFG